MKKGKAMMLEDAARMAGVRYTTAAYWIQTGLIRPRGYTGRKRTPVPVNDKIAGEIRQIAELRAAGISLQNLRKAARMLRARGFNPYSTGLFYVIDGPRDDRRLIHVTDEQTQAMELIGKNKGQLFLHVEALEKEIDNEET